MNFASLHEVLQVGFDWSDTCPHSFTFREGWYRVLPKDQFGEVDSYVELDEELTMLPELLPSSESIIYHYGLTEGWDHIITTGQMRGVDGSSAAYEEKCANFKASSHEVLEEEQDMLGVYIDRPFDMARNNEELKDLQFTPKLIQKDPQ